MLETGTYAGFVDAGYLIAEGATLLGKRSKDVRPHVASVVSWFLRRPRVDPSLRSFLRTYWYDGAFDSSNPSYAGQRRYFDAIAHTPGIQLRLGYLVERKSHLEGPIHQALSDTAASLGIAPELLIARFDENWRFYPDRHQKGVDTLMTLDLVRLASRSAFATAIVITGDRDLAEVIRTVLDYGVRVMIATPNRGSVASEVLQLADGVIDLTPEEVRAMLDDRPF
jgi:hypothetical protein